MTRTSLRWPTRLVAILMATAAIAKAEEVMVTQHAPMTFALSDSGEAVLSLFGLLYVQAPGQTEAQLLAGARPPARRPSISANGRWLVYEIDGPNAQIMLEDRQSGQITELSPGPWRNMMPTITADGERIVFSSDRDGTFDIWEVTRNGDMVSKRSFGAGNEHFPTFDKSGRQLAWIEVLDDWQRLMYASGYLRGRSIFARAAQLGPPSFRPDGRVILLSATAQERQQLFVVIDPSNPIAKPISSTGALSEQAPQWLDNQRFVLNRNGYIQPFALGVGPLARRDFRMWLTTPKLPTPIPANKLNETERNRGSFVIRVASARLDWSLQAANNIDIEILDHRIGYVGPQLAWQAGTAILSFEDAVAEPGRIAVLNEGAISPLDSQQWLRMGITSVACLVTACRDLDAVGPQYWLLPIQTTESVPASDRAQFIASARQQGTRVLSRSLYPDALLGANLLQLPALQAAILLTSGSGELGIPQQGYIVADDNLLKRSDLDTANAELPVVRFDRPRRPNYGPSNALRLAAETTQAAAALGLDHETGALVTQLQADIVVRDVHSGRLLAVVQAGRFFTPEGLDASN